MLRTFSARTLVAALVLAVGPVVANAASNALDMILFDLDSDLTLVVNDVNGDMDRVVDRAVTLLVNLDRTGASDKKLTKTAKAYKKQLSPIANSIFPRLNRLEANYIRRCIRENAGAGATGTVSMVIDESIEQVRADLFDARAAIDEALQNELND